jgi:hypothetical protein
VVLDTFSISIVNKKELRLQPDLWKHIHKKLVVVTKITQVRIKLILFSNLVYIVFKRDNFMNKIASI